MIWDNTQVNIEEYDDGGKDFYYNHGNGILVWVFEDEEKAHLALIDIPQDIQKRGIGSKLLQDFVDYCDKMKKRAYLTPQFSKTNTTEQLIRFYSKFGFVLQEDGKMYRGINKT